MAGLREFVVEFETGEVYRTFGRASLARRIRLCRVRRTSGVAVEDAPTGV